MHSSSQEETAEWMGYDSVEDMNADHDKLHEWLCDVAKMYSYSLAVRDGLPLTDKQKEIAWYEEDAVLHVQRWLQMNRKLNGR
jgi:hypothetical protein